MAPPHTPDPLPLAHAESDSPPAIDVVFVHGWSVSNTNTYGKLPERLVADAKAEGLNLRPKDIYLSRYISFHDEVRMEDLSFAMECAVAEKKLGADGKRFFCVTHSTGGPVVRDWYNRFHAAKPTKCPMSHLVMLAPANFGSALAQLGRERVGRIKAWFQGVEPGQGVLDWLELGSPSSWELNEEWIHNGGDHVGKSKIFPFVLTGQTIDRKLYDHLNSYTGETGSDGVIRVASANMNAAYISLHQIGPKDKKGFSTLEKTKDPIRSIETAMRVVRDRCHTGGKKGIMRSVKDQSDKNDVVSIITRCLKVDNIASYRKLTTEFAKETDDVQNEERIETKKRFVFTDHMIHDRYCQIIFRLRDDRGFPMQDFDLLLTAGGKSDPNHLPKGFFVDKQRNIHHPGTITYFVNYDVIHGCGATGDIRPPLTGIESLGLEVHPRPDSGFVHYRKCRALASEELLQAIVSPNQSTMVDITLTRVVHKETFGIDQTTKRENFKGISPGEPLN